ncbi:MAG: ribosome silencing factor [Gemmatimonadota bacterium]|nr:MAG: ribosome silencing factor [Gemmatimonadota bacterium]
MSGRESAISGAELRPADLPETVRRALELCQERNARELVVLDLRGLSDATDYFIIASGDSEVHVRAISSQVREGLSREGVRYLGVEGERAARWVLIDYIDLVVHIFHPVVREFYQLERLWGDAPMALIEIPGST